MAAFILTFFCSFYFPIDSWQTEVLEELQVRGEYHPAFTGIRPFTIDRDDPALMHAQHKLWNPVFSLASYHDTVSVVRVKPSIAYSWRSFALMVQPVVKFGDDSLPPDNKFMDMFSSHYERAYVKFESRYADIFVGRERFAAGPSSRNNLLLSGHSAPMDWLGYALHATRFKLTFLFSRLDDLHVKPYEYVGDTITRYIDAERYLTIKRLDIVPFEWLQLGLTEAGVFGGEHYSLEVYHFNPVVFLQAYQYNWNKDVNFFLQFDAKCFFNDWCVYGALMMDDFQLEADPNNEPHHLGFSAGLEAADPFGLRRTFWMVEYTAVTRFTYTHFVPFQRYFYQSTPIGPPNGPDHDEISGKVVYHVLSVWDVYTQTSYLRKGETRITDPWPIPEPREPGTSFPEDNFLSGIVQKSLSIDLGARVFPSTMIACDVMVGITMIDNYQHVIDEERHFFTLQACLHFFNW
ncbi:hypothetical protein JXB22_11095 [candidate division WOR-3 bacterium]|nr:hypothetical protein [candidate division WOR-3 bacterium]